MENQQEAAAARRSVWRSVVDGFRAFPVKRVWISTGYYCGLFIGVGGFLATKDRLQQYWTGELPMDDKVNQIGAEVKEIRAEVKEIRASFEKQDAKLDDMSGFLERIAAAQEAAAKAPVVAPAADPPASQAGAN